MRSCSPHPRPPPRNCAFRSSVSLVPTAALRDACAALALDSWAVNCLFLLQSSGTCLPLPADGHSRLFHSVHHFPFELLSSPMGPPTAIPRTLAPASHGPSSHRLHLAAVRPTVLLLFSPWCLLSFALGAGATTQGAGLARGSTVPAIAADPGRCQRRLSSCGRGDLGSWASWVHCLAGRPTALPGVSEGFVTLE